MRLVRSFTRPVLAIALAVAACGSVLVPDARAGSLSVMPVRIEVPPSRRFCSLTIGNGSDKPVTVQVRGFAWTRDENGADILDPDAGLMVNPPMAVVPAGGNRLVRCSLPAATAGEPQRQWRLIVDELPDPTQERPGIVQTLLRISVPVFRVEQGAAAHITAALGDKGLRIANTGDGYARVQKLKLVGDRTREYDIAFYLLSGGTQIVPTAQLPQGLIAVDLTTEEGEVHIPLPKP